MTVTCASCGLPGHRYGRNEGPERYDPMACINSLRYKNEKLGQSLATALGSLVEFAGAACPVDRALASAAIDDIQKVLSSDERDWSPDGHRWNPSDMGFDRGWCLDHQRWENKTGEHSDDSGTA